MDKENKFEYAQVLIDIARLDTKTFSYKIPDDLKNKIKIGQVVLVPFGTQGTVNAFVVGFTNYIQKGIKIKEIYEIAEENPIFSLEYLQFLEWIANYYCTSLQTVLEAAVPSAFITKIKKIVQLNKSFEIQTELSKEEQKIQEILVNKNKIPQSILLKSSKLTGIKFYGALRKLKQKGIVEILTETKEAQKSKKQKIIIYKNDDNATKREKEILKTIKELGIPEPPSLQEIIAKAKTTITTLKKLQIKGNIEIEEKEISRNPLSIFKDIKRENLAQLNEEQNFAFKTILNAINKKETAPILLYGITASGKTEVYFNLIKEVLQRGENVIFLVPEIALASQLAKRFATKFGIEEIAIWHSSISEGEKYDIWHKIKQNKIKIIIGARSAIFAPLTNLGLIIIDEEHESTYKQTGANPRYDARLVARQRAKRENAMLLLGSATPDINSYYEAINSNRLIVLTKRYNEVKLPDVKIVDMRFEHSQGAYKSIFSNILRNEIEKNIANKKQTILLVNRRGFSTTTTCQSCGYIAECPKCSIPLIYHKQTNTLRCHYCNYSRLPIKICPECGEETMHNYGLGTQKVEEYAIKDFPQARIARLDSDIMNKKNLHVDILNGFMEGKIDILIGTQMIAKGMDNPNVTLVGVMLADQSFNLPDYRASERGFQLLTQVAGRAGRGNFAGKVIFQSYSPDFFALKNAKQQDYKTFYSQEIQNRYELAYPPYSNLIRLIVSSKMEYRAEKIAMEIAFRLKELTISRGIEEKLEILGPSACVISKINNEYRFQILVKNRLGEKGHFLITSFIKSIKIPSEIKFLIDVDPTEML